MENTKEVIFELTGKTELFVVKKVKVTLDETIDIDNPPEGLHELIKDRFLRNYKKPFQEEIVTVLKDEDCDSFENERQNGETKDDPLIYMSEDYSYPRSVVERKPKWGCCQFMIEKGIKSVMTFGQMDEEYYERLSVYDEYFKDSWRFDGEIIFFTKEKDEIIEMYVNKDFKSIKNYTHSYGDIPKFKTYQNLFEKRSPNKEYKKIGGVFLLVIRDIESFRRGDKSKDSTVLGEIVL